MGNDFEDAENKKQTENFELIKKIQNIEFKNDDLKKEKEWNENILLQNKTKINKLEKEKNNLSLNIDRINKKLDEMKIKYNEIEYKYNSSIKKCEDLEDKLKQSENMILSLKCIKTEFDVN